MFSAPWENWEDQSLNHVNALAFIFGYRENENTVSFQCKIAGTSRAARAGSVVAWVVRILSKSQCVWKITLPISECSGFIGS